MSNLGKIKRKYTNVKPSPESKVEIRIYKSMEGNNSFHDVAENVHKAICTK